MVNLPFSGHTNPTLELAKTFVSLGHEVTYIHSPEWKNKIEESYEKAILIYTGCTDDLRLF